MKHWLDIDLVGSTNAAQRAAREYAEQYSASANEHLLRALEQIASTQSTSLALEYVQGIARAAIAKATGQP